MTSPDHQIADERTPSIDEFEDLFVNNPELDKLRGRLNRFNPIRTMGMERMEIRHTAILRWLFDPQETHGLGDGFLRGFLAEALRGRAEFGSPTALDIIRADLSDVEVRREWRGIDLLILSPSNGWVFVLENKFDSGQHSDQLRRYLDLAGNVLGSRDEKLVAVGIFLTLHDEEPEDDRYAPIQYDIVCECVSSLLEARAHPLSPEVEIFVRHYLEVIMEATGMSEAQGELEKLAKQLYRDHRKVIDFVVEHGSTTEFAIAAESVFGESLEYLTETKVNKQRFAFDEMGNDYVSFLPWEWYEAFGEEECEWEGCNDWWAGYPLAARVSLLKAQSGSGGRVALYAEVGPLADHDLRAEIINALIDVSKKKGLSRIRFQAGAADEGRRYSRFLRKNFVDIDDVQDPEKIAAAIKKLLKEFKPEFEAVGSVLPKFQEHGAIG